jgi:hypothetical protein
MEVFIIAPEHICILLLIYRMYRMIDDSSSASIINAEPRTVTVNAVPAVEPQSIDVIVPAVEPQSMDIIVPAVEPQRVVVALAVEPELMDVIVPAAEPPCVVVALAVEPQGYLRGFYEERCSALAIAGFQNVEYVTQIVGIDLKYNVIYIINLHLNDIRFY